MVLVAPKVMAPEKMALPDGGAEMVPPERKIALELLVPAVAERVAVVPTEMAAPAKALAPPSVSVELPESSAVGVACCVVAKANGPLMVSAAGFPDELMTNGLAVAPLMVTWPPWLASVALPPKVTSSE